MTDNEKIRSTLSKKVKKTKKILLTMIEKDGIFHSVK